MIRFATKVTQPIGDFYLVSLPARVLNKVCFARPYERYRQDASGSVENSPWYQRVFVRKRANPIAEFLKTAEATLPGTIVLAANYTADGKVIDDGKDDFPSDLCWRARRCDVGILGHEDGLYELNIPDNQISAMVVDGQHRLGGFKNQGADILSMEVPCAVFIGLPIPLQAYIFATINFNQKPVNKSLNYELFAFDIDNVKPIAWSPDQFAVFVSRRLNSDEASPLRSHIKIGAVDCTEEAELRSGEWKVSTATIVSGIMSLITKDPQCDRNRINQAPVGKRDRSLLIGLNCDEEKLPVRTLYIENRDDLIYTTVLKYFVAAETLLNKGDFDFPVFHKTAGVTALFQALKILLVNVFKDDAIDLSSTMWIERFSTGKKMVNFNDPWLLGSSGTHVGRIRDALLLMAGYRQLEEFSEKDYYSEYVRLWNDAQEIPNA